MSAAIWYERDGYKTDSSKLMGRQAAGAGFLDALIRFGRSDRIVGMVRTREDQQDFLDTVKRVRPERRAMTIVQRETRALQDIGCLYMPQPLQARDAWFRHLHGPRAWSLCGVTHTIASAEIMDAVTGWPTAPFQPWDAIVCTSQSVKTALGRLLEAQAAFLRERVGATRFPLPSLPVIPLGVDCDAFATSAQDRAEARRAVGLDPGDVVVLFVGRLSFHAKANPAPMYIALERLAKTHPVVLIECGYASNARIADAFAQGREILCPSVRVIALEGRDPALRRVAWATADIFCSLSDNIQESFGMTPIEAMAAGLPSVITDWNGYRETIRHGIDGFLIPTHGALPGTGRDLAHAYATEADSYDMYVAQSALAVAADIDDVTKALRLLIGDAALRRRMGENAARRARDLYDWRHIVKAYEALWADLAARRAFGDKESSPPRTHWPGRPDPFALFSHYPSDHLAATAVLRLKPDDIRAVFEARLGLKMATLDRHTLPMASLLKLRDGLEEPGVSVEKLVRGLPDIRPIHVYRGVLLMLKFGLIEIDPKPLE